MPTEKSFSMNITMDALVNDPIDGYHWLPTAANGYNR